MHAPAEIKAAVLVDWTETFPKFIVGGDPGDRRIFVVHLHYPRFVGECARQPGGSVAEMHPHWIDHPGTLSTESAAKLLNEARAFVRGALANAEQHEDIWPLP